MSFQAILFDLDGTLLDTLTDLANSMNSALVQLGFEPHPRESYRYFVGDGIEHLVRRILPKEHLNEKTTNEYIAIMEDEYGKRWNDNTKPYPGIAELLNGLEQRNIPKAVLSNKPDVFTQIVVENLLSQWSFCAVQGAVPEVPKKPHPGVAIKIANELGVAATDCLFIGDTNTDMKTACSARMYGVGVLWGFRGAEELLANGAKSLVEKPEDILAILDNGQ